MKLVTVGDPVLPGREDHQEPTRGNLGGGSPRPGDAPEDGIRGIVGEKPASRIDDLGTRIVNLDPIGKLPVVVRQHGVVDREDLIDVQILGWKVAEATDRGQKAASSNR